MPKKKYYQRPDGLYETSRTVNGKRYMFRGKTIAEVDRKILQFNSEKTNGRPLDIVANEWYDNHCSEIAVSTRKTYGHAVKRLTAHYGNKSVGKITPMDLQRYIHDFGQQGYARTTVSIELTVIKLIFSYAVLCGDIPASPATEVSIARNLPKKKRSAITEEQQRKVMNCKSGDGWLYGYMLLYTGCRRGELLALNWQDIDLEQNVIHIYKKLNYAETSSGVIEYNLKSENGKRDIPLFAPLKAVLPTNQIGLIFKNENGNHLSHNESLNLWKSYCKSADLLTEDEFGNIVPQFTPHCLRHSFSTICFEAGIDIKSTAAMLGDTEAIVQNIYTDLRKNQHATSVEKLNAYFELQQQEQQVITV